MTTEAAGKQSPARLLSAKLASILHRFLAGSVDGPAVAAELRKLAAWIEAGAKPKEGKRNNEQAAQRTEQAEAIFAHWIRSTGRDKQTKFTQGRRQKVLARLAEGYSVRDLLLAIDGAAASSFHQGKNDRSQRFDDLELICRNGAKVEQFRAMAGKSEVESEDGVEITELRERAVQALKDGDADEYAEANRLLAGLLQGAS